MTPRGARIVFVHYTTPAILGGVEQVMGAQAAALRDLGARVTIVAGRGRAAPRGVRLARVPEVDSRHAAVLRDFDRLARGEVTAEHRALVARLVRALRPHVARADRVVVHNVLTMHLNLALAEAIARLGREHRGRVIAWTHDLAWRDPRYAGELHPGAPWDVIARPQPGVRYVAISAERARELARLLRVARASIPVVPNGIDVAAALGISNAGARVAERLGLYDADPLLLLPARITRRKRIEAAIDAVAALRARGRTGATLVVTGPPGAHSRTNAAYLRELRARAEGTAGVHFLYALGIRPSTRVMADLYALADALLLPSEAEGFGIPMLEAGLRRLPIVCSDLPTLRAVAADAATYVPVGAGGPLIARAVERSLGRAMPALARRVKAHAWPRVVRDRVVPVILGGARARGAKVRAGRGR